MRQTIIAGNWKMYKTIGEATAFLKDLTAHIKQATSEAWIAPPFTAIAACAAQVKGTSIVIGAQNMSDKEEGAYTGEVSARMVKDAGAKFVILGHSERRTLFGETNELIHHKLKRAFLEGISPILCIGESNTERESGNYEKVLKKQLEACLNGFTAEELRHLRIAYEPVWAIGTGKTATPEMAQDAHLVIRDFMSENWSLDLAESLSILYGGSVKPANIKSLLNQSDIDGALIGGASLDVQAFTQMVLS